MTKKNAKSKNKNTPDKDTSSADAVDMQNNYCSLINKDFDAAMKVLFEEEPVKKQPGETNKK